MRYAVLAGIICCWTAAAFLYRLASRREASREWIAAAAAFTWFSLTLVLAVVGGALSGGAPGVLYITGAVGGTGVVAAMPFFMAAVARGNLAVSWTILTLSFAAASLLSIVYPRSAGPSLTGVLGLAAAAAAIVLLGKDGAAHGAAGRTRRGWGLFMSLAFAANSLYMYMLALADARAGLDAPENKAAFLLSETGVFLAGSVILLLFGRRSRGALAGIAIGAGIGSMFFIGNLASTYCVADLGVAPYIFFPTTTGGSTLTVALISAFIFNERPGRAGWLGLAVGLAAMVLLGGSS